MKVRSAISIAAAGMAIVFSLAAPREGLAQGAVVEPGQTVFFAEADDLDLDLDCSLPNVCYAEAYVHEAKILVTTYIPAAVQSTIHAEGTLQNLFTLSGDPQLQRVLRGNLSGTISWAGKLHLTFIFLNGAAEATITSKVRLTDLTEGRVVADQDVFERSCSASACLTFPQGSAPYNLTVDLIRGHQYRFDFIARCESRVDGVGASNNVWCDFLDSPNAVSRGPIRLTVERDLEEEIDALWSELRALRRRFNTHTHTYLTGKGEGHNNTTATTSKPPR